VRLKDERRYCIFADLGRAPGRDPPTLLAPFRIRTTHIVHLGLIRSSRPLFSVRQLGDLANGSPGVGDGALNSARGNKDSYIVQLRQSIRFASVTDCMQSVVFPSAFRILARAKIGANRSRAFSSARRIDSRVGW
jgi:hypothetical protein